MKLFAAGFLIGVLCCAAAAAGVGRRLGEEQQAVGRKQGELDGIAQAVKMLRDEFGTIDSAAGRPLFSLKTSSVVVIEVDGVRTVRVVP